MARKPHGGEVLLQATAGLRLLTLLLKGGGAGLKALEDATCLTAQADDGVVVDALALDDQGLQALALDRQAGGCLHESEVALGKLVESAELGPVYLAEIAEASRVG